MQASMGGLGTLVTFQLLFDPLLCESAHLNSASIWFNAQLVVGQSL